MTWEIAVLQRASMFTMTAKTMPLQALYRNAAQRVSGQFGRLGGAPVDELIG
jgi:hypothetical protein